MSDTTSSDPGFVPGSLQAAAPKTVKHNPTPVRLSFEPFGRRRVGDADPYSPGYQRLDGHIRYVERGIATGHVIVNFRDIAGRDFIVAPGEAYRAMGEVPDGLGDEMALSDYRWVLGRERAGGDGYIPVGINPVYLIPE